jgi:cation diffusion facilitator CzcD-associated flavoprotein CzcO
LPSAVRGAICAAREQRVLGFVKQPRGLKLLERIATRHRERPLRDPGLTAAATPRYALGCKRILPSNDWYPALRRSNVELVTAAWARFARGRSCARTGASSRSR